MKYSLLYLRVDCLWVAWRLSVSSRLLDNLQVACAPVVRFFVVIGQPADQTLIRNKPRASLF
ncbi:MAG: hypothetical protein WAT85_08995, partial [Trichococcus flocculiformis]